MYENSQILQGIGIAVNSWSTLNSATLDGVATIPAATLTGVQQRDTTMNPAGTTTNVGFSSPNTGTILAFEIVPVRASMTIPTVDRIMTHDNGTGTATSNFSLVTSAANELLLLAVSWRSTAAMTTAPTGGPGNWTPIGSTVVRGTVSTQLYRTFATVGYPTSSYASVEITWPGGVKGTAVLAAIRGANATGTFGSGAIDAYATSSNNTLNPSLGVTTLTANALVVSFAAFGNDVAPTPASYWTSSTASSSGGGGGTTKSTLSFQYKNSHTQTPGAVTSTFTHAATDWTMHTVAIKP